MCPTSSRDCPREPPNGAHGRGLAYSGPGLAYSGPGLAYSGPGLAYSGPGLAYSGPPLSLNFLSKLRQLAHLTCNCRSKKLTWPQLLSQLLPQAYFSMMFRPSRPRFLQYLTEFFNGFQHSVEKLRRRFPRPFLTPEGSPKEPKMCPTSSRDCPREPPMAVAQLGLGYSPHGLAYSGPP